MSGHILLVFFALMILSLIKKKWGLAISFILLLWLFSFRTSEIPDTDTYRWMYEDPLSRLGLTEIGFIYLGIVFHTITGAEFLAYTLFLVGMCLMLWYISARNLLPGDERIGILFLIFVSFYGFFYLGITIRNCISELLVLCGISFYMKFKGARRVLIYYAFVLGAMLIHRSAAFFLLLIPLIKIKVSTKGFYRIYIICIILWLVSGLELSRGIIRYISQLTHIGMDYYLSTADYMPSMFSLQILLNFFISFFAIRYLPQIDIQYRPLYNFFLKINMMGMFTMSVIWPISTSYRFYNMFFFFNFIPIYLMLFHNAKFNKRGVAIKLSLLVSCVYFVLLLYCFPEMLRY